MRDSGTLMLSAHILVVPICCCQYRDLLVASLWQAQGALRSPMPQYSVMMVQPMAILSDSRAARNDGVV